MTAVISVGLFDAKTRLSEYVARAEAGEEVVIMRHNKPVAKLVPLSASSAVPTQSAVEPPPFRQRTFPSRVLVEGYSLNKLAADLEDEGYIEVMRQVAREREGRE